MTSSLYESLGLVAPIILPAKKLLQDLCKQKLGWDDPINDDDKERWEKWKNQLSGLPKITVNRCFRPVGFGELKLVELHSFADASQVAYGDVCYLRLVDVNDRMHCAFLVGRSRLAYLRPMTMPRLELCAAGLAVQLKQSITEELDILVTKSTFWSDSTCMLQYIKNQSRRFHTFVADRLSIIHELSTPYHWRHVPSELNPADEISRGVTVQDVINNSKWLNGPMFLRKNEESWPSDLTNVPNNQLLLLCFSLPFWPLSLICLHLVVGVDCVHSYVRCSFVSRYITLLCLHLVILLSSLA